MDNEKLASSEPALIVRCPCPSRNPSLNLTLSTGSLQPYTASKSGAWQQTTLSSAKISLADPSTPSKALEAARRGRSAELGDFDDHLADASIDWLRNPRVQVV